MAEYLNEEDMNTGEYISRDVALRQLNATCLATDCNNYNGVMCRACAYADAMDFIDAIPAADVQPVNQWISVKDRLPEDNKPVLCFVIDTTGEGSSYVIGSCEHSEFWFLKIGDNKRFSFPHMQIKVTHWQPLPEPPKDGDTE